MDDISDVSIFPLEKSQYIKPLRMHFKQNGKQKIWDAMEVHDSVVILIYNKTRQTFVLVKQFRPAVYLASSEVTQKADGTRTIDTTKHKGATGVTYELCAGIVDKDCSLQMIAQAEILEECGYKVPLDNVEYVSSYRSGVGTSGSQQNLFYCEVTDEMKISAGGGVAEEGEMIDVVEIPVSEGKNFITDSSYNKPVFAMYALMWFYDVKWKQYSNSDKN